MATLTWRLDILPVVTSLQVATRIVIKLDINIKILCKTIYVLPTQKMLLQRKKNSINNSGCTAKHH